MTEKTSNQKPTPTGSSQHGLLEITNFPIGSSANRFASHVVNVDRRSLSNTVFHIDDNTFTSSLPRASHWSIAWSDLMMTMFVLFLSMFAYQTAHQEFLAKKTPEVIGGDTTEAIQTLDSSGTSFPFVPIHPGLPLITGGTIKKVEKVHIDSLDSETVYTEELRGDSEIAPEKKQESAPSQVATVQPETTAQIVEADKESAPPITIQPPPQPVPTEAVIAPTPPESLQPPPTETEQFQEIYTLSKDALENNNLDKFATIDIIPDKTMRIILTGDLFFALGESELSDNARESLQKVVEVMRHTPYMINVVGHTDNLPMRSNRFISNWELSVARASSVARFLIEKMGMNPNQFVVSGYSSYRPIAPNTTAENRAKNRRVEIIISKRLPNPLPATPQNLK